MSAVPEVMAQGIDMREGYRCLRCGRHMVDPPVGGFSRHHRIPRAVGGHTYPNIILLCGSGTTGCHGWVHSHPIAARHDGLILDGNHRPPLDPAILPVRLHTGYWKLLDAGGFYGETVPEATARELLYAFGQLRGSVA